MFVKMPFRAAIFVAAVLLGTPAAFAQTPQARFQNVAVDDERSFSTQELDQILAPIALYPDDVLANVLMAATYPLEVVEAARWIDEPENADLKGAALERALDDKDWDPSVKSLTQFPDLLVQMSENLDWMRDVGDAMLADQAAVMDRVQFLRTKAEDAGNLQSNDRRRVVTREEDDREYIYIEPAEPDVVYVPVYEPAVYGRWWYDDYPPYYWDYDYSYVGFYYWGVGVAVVPTLWRWSTPRWRRHYIHVDRRRYNRLTRHKLNPGVNRWHHNARHRRGVRYNDARLRRRHQRESIRGARRNGVALPKRHRLKPGRDGRPNIERRKLRPPREGERRGNFKGRNVDGKNVRRNLGPQPTTAPRVKKRDFNGKPRDLKSIPKKQIKKGPPPNIKKRAVKKRPPGIKKRPPSAKKNQRAGPTKKGRPKGGARNPGKRRAGPPPRAGGKPRGQAKPKPPAKVKGPPPAKGQGKGQAAGRGQRRR